MKKNDIRLIILISIILITMILLKMFSTRTEGILIKYAKNKSINSMSQIVDKTIRSIMEKNEFDEILYIENNEEINQTYLNFDNNKINRILNLSTKKIYESIKEIERTNKIYNISSGLLIKNHLLNNLGPSIPYKIDLLGEVNTNAYTKIKEYGINNSMVEIILDIKIEFQVLLPFVTDTFKIEKEIILDSKIIQGNIPNYYAN